MIEHVLALILDSREFDLHAEVSAITVAHTPHSEPDEQQLLLVGGRWGAMPGHGTVGLRVETDIAIGAQLGSAGGFAYDVSLLPFGVGVIIDKDAWFAVSTGVNLTGATGAVDDGIAVPIAATLEDGSLIARLRGSYLFGREDRAPSLGNHVTADAFLGVGFSTEGDKDRYYFGVTYSEMFDARYAGAVLGYELGTRGEK